MSRSIPSYIQSAAVSDRVLRYRWDDWRLEDVYGDLSDEDLYQRLEGLSYRAAVALTVASAEWVVHRYDVVSDDPVPTAYAEAGWAAVINEHYLSQWQPPDEDWMGPIRGPLSVAMLIIREAVGTAVHEHEQAVPVLYIGNLAVHVLRNPQPFLTWRDEVLDRLLALYPIDPQETLGDVVPREALDPSFPFMPIMTEPLIRDFLASLNYETNPFLVRPEEMLELGFEGVPYQFDFQDDRRNRFEW